MTITVPDTGKLEHHLHNGVDRKVRFPDGDRALDAYDVTYRHIPIGAVIPKNADLCERASFICGDSGKQKFSFSGTNSSMAAGLPHAIGAQAAYPDRQLVVCTGDRSLANALRQIDRVGANGLTWHVPGTHARPRLSWEGLALIEAVVVEHETPMQVSVKPKQAIALTVVGDVIDKSTSLK